MQQIVNKAPRSITAEFFRLPECVWLEEIDEVVKDPPRSAREVKIDRDCITWFMTTEGGCLYFTCDQRFDIITKTDKDGFSIIHAEPNMRHSLPSHNEWFALRFQADSRVFIDCSQPGIELTIEPEV